MAGYFINSLDPAAFHHLTTAATLSHGLLLADVVLDQLDELMDEYGDEDAATARLWPRDRHALARAIQKRLVAPAWYADFTLGDGTIWDGLLHEMITELDHHLGLDVRAENDGYLYWDAAERAAGLGAALMAEPRFGNYGFRYAGRSRGELELLYTVHLPDVTRTLLRQLEQVAPAFEALPDEEDGEKAQFVQGLLDPVRRIVAEGRVMWVQTDT